MSDFVLRLDERTDAGRYICLSLTLEPSIILAAAGAMLRDRDRAAERYANNEAMLAMIDGERAHLRRVIANCTLEGQMEWPDAGQGIGPELTPDQSGAA